MYKKWSYKYNVLHPKFLILGAGSNLFSPEDVAQDLINKLKSPDSLLYDLSNTQIPHNDFLQLKTKIKNTPYHHHIIKIQLPCVYTIEQLCDLIINCPATFILIGSLFARLIKSRNLLATSIILPPLDNRIEKPFLATYPSFDFHKISLIISNLYKKCHKHVGVFQDDEFYYYDMPLELKTKWQWERLLCHVVLYRKLQQIHVHNDVIRLILRYACNM